MKLSIVVPVYGVEKYVEQCIKSLLFPDCYDYEIIIVNDGTKDRSIDIIRDNFSDSRIRIIEQENSGLSAARNHGIREAKGDYLWFFDSDDWAEEIKIEDILSELHDVDLFVFDRYYRDFDNSGKQYIVENRVEADSGYELASQKYFHQAQFYIFNKELFVKFGLYFKEGILHEDSLFTPQIILMCKTVKCYKQPVYHYRVREGSITNSIVSSKRIFDLITVLKALIGFGEDGCPVEIKYKWGRCIVQIVNELLFVTQKSSNIEMKSIVRSFVNNNYSILSYLVHSNFNNKFMGILAFIFAGDLYDVYSVLYRIRYR